MDLNRRVAILRRIAEDIHNPVRRFRLAAGVWHKNNLVGLGVNSYKTSPFQAKYGRHEHCIHLHAEVAAIKNAVRQQQDLSRNCTLIVVRVKKENTRSNIFKLALAKPCDGCYRCIVEFGIDNIYYSTGRKEEVVLL
jgi:deoxycytidylate deaminase